MKCLYIVEYAVLFSWKSINLFYDSSEAHFHESMSTANFKISDCWLHFIHEKLWLELFLDFSICE